MVVARLAKHGVEGGIQVLGGIDIRVKEALCVSLAGSHYRAIGGVDSHRSIGDRRVVPQVKRPNQSIRLADFQSQMDIAGDHQVTPAGIFRSRHTHLQHINTRAQRLLVGGEVQVNGDSPIGGGVNDLLPGLGIVLGIVLQPGVIVGVKEVKEIVQGDRIDG